MYNLLNNIDQKIYAWESHHKHECTKPCVPKGTELLGTGIQRLKNLHKAEKNAKARLAGRIHDMTEEAKEAKVMLRILMTEEIGMAKMYDY